MKKYYIVSLRHTSKGDTALTFWGHNSNGYRWNRSEVGVYSEEEIPKIQNHNNVAVEVEKVDKYWMNAKDFGDNYVSVPNNQTVLHDLGLDSAEMKPKKFAGCRMVFLNTPVNQ